jgi:hypothetical protein
VTINFPGEERTEDSKSDQRTVVGVIGLVQDESWWSSVYACQKPEGTCGKLGYRPAILFIHEGFCSYMSDPPKVGTSTISGKGEIPNPGILGLDLSIANNHIEELHHDDSLSREERQVYLQYYFYQCEKIQTQLKTLALQERVQLCEKALAEKENAVTFARSEAGIAKARERWQKQLMAVALSSGGKNAYETSKIPKSSEEAEQAYIQAFEIERQDAASALSTARSELDASILLLKALSQNDARWNQHLPAIKEWERTQNWEHITPEALRPSVKALRKKFDHHAWQVRKSTEVFCYEALHSQGPSQLKPQDAPEYQKYLIAFLGETGRQLFTREKLEPPAIFKRYLDAYHVGVKITIAMIFHELLEIANQQAHVLPTHPIKWTKNQLQILIRSEKTDVKQWIKAVCDPQDNRLSTEDIDESIYWGRWRAPRLLFMRPAAYAPYDSHNPWSREDVERSQTILEGHGKHFSALLEVALDQIVDESHIKFAKEKDLDQDGDDRQIRTKAPKKRSGPQSKFPDDFVKIAGELWQKALPVGKRSKVTISKLRQIATELDATGFSRPGDFLEGTTGQKLRQFNSHNSNSVKGAITTWTALVGFDDKEFTRGFRRLLSRCSEKLENK